MQKLIVGVLAAASVVGAVAVTAATPTEASAQPYYGYHHRFYRHRYYHPYYGPYHRRFYHRPYYRY